MIPFRSRGMSSSKGISGGARPVECTFRRFWISPSPNGTPTILLGTRKSG
jgi:hypothetical protein